MTNEEFDQAVQRPVTPEHVDGLLITAGLDVHAWKKRSVQTRAPGPKYQQLPSHVVISILTELKELRYRIASLEK